MNNRRFLILALCILTSCGLAFSAASPAKAEDLADPNAVYVVDMQKVIAESVAGKSARNNLERAVKEGESQFSGDETSLQKAEQDFQKQVGVLSPKALEAKRDDLEKKKREFMRKVQDQREIIQRQHDSEVMKIVKEIDKIIADLAAAENYKFIVEKDERYVIYVDPKYDISAKVLEQLNRRNSGV